MDTSQHITPSLNHKGQDLQEPPNPSTGCVPSCTPDLENLKKSLTTCDAWGETLFQYKGIWLYPVDVNSTLLCEKNFQARDSDILVATLPKSGTTWLKSIVFAITKRAEHPLSGPNHPLHAANSHALVPFFEFIYRDSHNPESNLSTLPSPRLFSTHNAYNVLPESLKSANSRIIYLCRDQKDTLISLWHFVNKINQQTEGLEPLPLEQVFEWFCKGTTDRGPTWDHVLGYWNASLKEPEKVLFLKYEDLKSDIIPQVKKIAEFLGFPFSAEEESEGLAEQIAKLCSFESLSNLKVNTSDGKRFVDYVDNALYFRKGKVGDWANYLTPSMAEQLDQIMEQKLEGSGLKFD